MSQSTPSLATQAAREKWVAASSQLRPDERRIYQIDRFTLKAVLQSVLFGQGTSGYVIDRGNGAISATSAGTIEQINDPSIAPPLVAAALAQLRTDSGIHNGRFPPNYYMQFSRAMFNQSIAASGPLSGVDAVQANFGVEVGSSPSFAAYHAYEAIARTGEHNGWDKVQHFVRSAAIAFKYPKPIVDTNQYFKEIFLDEIPGWWNRHDAFDPNDMLANNLGQTYGAELLRRYRPIRAGMYSPIYLFENRVTQPIGGALQRLEREIWQLYGVNY